MATGGRSSEISLSSKTTTKPGMKYSEKLLEKAKSFCKKPNDEVAYFYRNKSKDYFDEVEKNGNVMKPQLKDEVGDPRSPINGKLSGVFFCVTLFNGKLPTISPYGEIRIRIPMQELFTETSNLYFADFYCFGCDNHYIILVLTKQDTDADVFCQKNLPKLDPYHNPFLCKEGDVFKTQQRPIWVEVFYTEEVDIKSLQKCWKEKVFEERGITKVQRGSYNKEKKKFCKICNLSENELQEVREEAEKLESDRKMESLIGDLERL